MPTITLSLLIFLHLHEIVISFSRYVFLALGIIIHQVNSIIVNCELHVNHVHEAQ